MSFDNVLHVFEEALGASQLPPLQALNVAYKKAVLVAHPDKGGSNEAMHFLHELLMQRRKIETGVLHGATVEQNLFHSETGSDTVKVGRENGQVKTIFVTRNCEVEVNMSAAGEPPLWQKRHIDAYPWTIRVTDGKLLVGREEVALGEGTTLVDVKLPRNLYFPVNLQTGDSQRRISSSYRFWPGEEVVLPFEINSFRQGTLHITRGADLDNDRVLNVATQYLGPTANGRHSFLLPPDDSGLLTGMRCDGQITVIDSEECGRVTTQIVMPHQTFNTIVVWNLWQREPTIRSPYERKRKRNQPRADGGGMELKAIDGTPLQLGESCCLMLYKVSTRKRVKSWTLLTEVMFKRKRIDVSNLDKASIRLLSGVIKHIDSEFFTFVPTSPPSRQGYITDLQQLSQTWRLEFATGQVVLARTYQLCKPFCESKQ